jgi:hypothetical protein
MAGMRADGEATILGLVDAPASDDEDDFEVRPAGEFDFDLHEASRNQPAARNLDAEIASLDSDADLVIDESPRPLRPAPPVARPATPVKPPAIAPAAARKPSAPPKLAPSDVWELDEPGAAPAPASGPLALTLEIDGLSGELRRKLEALFGKVIELPSLRVKIKGRDLG